MGIFGQRKPGQTGNTNVGHGANRQSSYGQGGNPTRGGAGSGETPTGGGGICLIWTIGFIAAAGGVGAGIWNIVT